MRWWVTLRFWLRAVTRAGGVRAEIDEEIAQHLRMRAQELEAEGLSPRDAHRAAGELFGDVDRIRDACRKAYLVDLGSGEGVMDDFIQDLRFGLRAMARQPGFTVAVVATLGLGIGANSAIFSVLHGVLLTPLPYEEPSELVRVWQADRVNGTRFENFSAPDYFDVVERASALSAAAVVELRTPTLTGPEGDAERLSGVAASERLSGTLGLQPSIGRWFSVEEDRPGGTSVAVLGHDLWVRRFGSSPSIVGSSIRLDGVVHEVVGVLPPEVDFPRAGVQVWIPLQIDAGSRPRSQHNFRMVARLGPDVSVEQSNDELSLIASALAEEYPAENEGREMWAQPLHESVIGDVSTALYLLGGAVGLVLLIACVNVANLLIVRGVRREHEVAVRCFLGAPRARLLRQLLTEHLLLGLVGGVVGLVLAAWGIRALVALGPESLPRLDVVGLDGTLLAFTFAVTLATSLLCGLLPAVQGSSARAHGSLGHRAGYAAASRRAHRVGHALVVAEVAMAVVLVAGAGLLVESLTRLNAVDPGFDPDGVLSASVELPAARYDQPRPQWPNYPEVLAFQREVLEGALRLPGVTHAGLAMNGPADPGWTTGFAAELVPPESIERTEEVRIRIISAGYPEAIGMELVRGRFPEPRDDLFETPPVALINEAMARRYFADQDPIGSWISNWGIRREIIGIVRDVRFMGLAEAAEPAVYPLFARMPLASFSILVRTTGDPVALAQPLRQVVAEVDPELALGSVGTLRDLLSATTGTLAFNTLLLALFAGLSLVLAAVGIYGVIAHGVSQRTHEIGVRLSLGATSREVSSRVVRQALALTGAGVAIGLVGAVASARLLSGMLFEVGPLDVSNLVTVVLIAFAVGAAGGYLPARRASRVDPVRAVVGE